MEAKRINIADLLLDASNPRLSIDQRSSRLSQPALLDIMATEFDIDELGESFIENGLFEFEPLLALRSNSKLIVIEGNRRLAALKLLVDGPPVHKIKSKRFEELHKAYLGLTPKLRSELEKPFVSVVQNRASVAGYIGFRHVTGIKQWPALEKAGYMARLVDENDMKIEDVALLMGSKSIYVARHLHAYRMLMQARNEDLVDTDRVESSFGVFMRALQVDGVYAFLNVSPPTRASVRKRPLSPKSKPRFREFVQWAFGDTETQPLFTDSRRLTDFGAIVRSKNALSYLRAADQPDFEEAFHLSGHEHDEALRAIRVAQFALRDCVAAAPLMKKNAEFREAVRRCRTHLEQILQAFPALRVDEVAVAAR